MKRSLAIGLRLWPVFFLLACAKPDLDLVRGMELKQQIERDRGSVVIVNLWASWCKPCLGEMPEIVAASQKYAPWGVKLYLVSTDIESNWRDVDRLTQEWGVNEGIFVKGEKDTPFIDGLGADWSGVLPTTLLYDRGGKLRKVFEGVVTRRDLEIELVRILEEAKP